MAGIIFITLFFLVLAGAGGAGFWAYRRGLRFAKSIERGIKMVPILISLPPPSDDVEVGSRDVRDVIQEKTSQAEVLYNLIASTATKGFKSRFFGQRHIGFEIVAIDGIIRFYAAVPVALTAVIKQAILTAYPGAQLEEVEDHNIFSPQGKISGTYGGEVNLKHSFSYPIATVDQLKRDAMQAMINAMTSLEAGDGAGIQILLRPAHEGWVKTSEDLVKKKKEGKDKSGISGKALLQAPFKAPESGKDDSPKPPKQLTSLEQSVLDAVEEKTRSAGYEVLIRVVASSNTASRAQAVARSIVSSFSLFDAPGLNGFKFSPAKDMEKFVTHFIFRFFPPEKNRNILNSIELATLFHFPDDQFTRTTKVQRQYSKQVEGPSRTSKEGLLIGHNVYRGVRKEIRLGDEDRRRHVYVVGQTGTGKTVLLQNMMVQDMKDGKGFAFIDPHGDAAEELLGMVPKDRVEDVIYFDPGNFDYPMGLNLFEFKTPEQKDFLIQETINMLEKLYDPHQQGIVGPRYHHMFRNAALTVMADPEGGTFVDIPKLFRDPQFVRQKLKHVEDKTVKEFWEKEIPQAQRSNDFGEVTSWFVSKFGAFLSNEMMRDIIGQSKSAFDLREVMDDKKILIANLSKGRLGELNSKLLGMIFVMKFQAAAMSRANIPESQRQDFSLYVDEFQNFSTESFGFILSEARKYRLQLIVANQFISQLSDDVKGAVFGNAGTIISFRIGPDDADYLAKQLAPAFNDRDLVSVPNHNIAIRLMNGGQPSQPFTMSTLPPLGTENPKLAGALKQLSAAKFGKPRAEVEEAIFSRLAIKEAPSPFDSLASSRSKSQAPAVPAGGKAGSSPAGNNSSFLDEWLAKRRQAMRGSGGPLPGSGAPSPPQNNRAAANTQPRTSSVPPATGAGTQHPLNPRTSDKPATPRPFAPPSGETSSSPQAPRPQAPDHPAGRSADKGSSRGPDDSSHRRPSAADIPSPDLSFAPSHKFLSPSRQENPKEATVSDPLMQSPNRDKATHQGAEENGVHSSGNSLHQPDQPGKVHEHITVRPPERHDLKADIEELITKEEQYRPGSETLPSANQPEPVESGGSYGTPEPAWEQAMDHPSQGAPLRPADNGEIEEPKEVSSASGIALPEPAKKGAAGTESAPHPAQPVSQQPALQEKEPSLPEEAGETKKHPRQNTPYTQPGTKEGKVGKGKEKEDLPEKEDSEDSIDKKTVKEPDSRRPAKPKQTTGKPQQAAETKQEGLPAVPTGGDTVLPKQTSRETPPAGDSGPGVIEPTGTPERVIPEVGGKDSSADESPPKLSPGEIYIDESGQIHRG